MDKRLAEAFGNVRKLFPATSGERPITYFNYAGTGPININSRKKMDWYYDECYFHNRDTDNPAFKELEFIRKTGAKFVGANEDEIGFGFNTGFGLNLAAFGLRLKEGDEVLLSDVEFPSNVYPWTELQNRGIKIKFIESTNRFFDIEKFKKSITANTRVLSLSFVQFFNGYKNDLKQIGEICRESDIYFVVDAIQGCGAEPIDVRECQIDILAAGAQKWLLSPLGCGFFFVRKEIQNELLRPFASWLAVDWQMNFTDMFNYHKPPFDSARKYELGTYPYGHVFAMAESFRIIDSLGIENIQAHNHELIDILIDYLQSDSRYRITSNLAQEHRSSILTFTCDNAPELHRSLLKQGIICTIREGSIRIAVHLPNNSDDIKTLITALKKG